MEALPRPLPRRGRPSPAHQHRVGQPGADADAAGSAPPGVRVPGRRPGRLSAQLPVRHPLHPGHHVGVGDVLGRAPAERGLVCRARYVDADAD